VALILIVDDDPAIRESLTEVLRDEGYDVIEGANGADALALLERGPLPAAIILDLMMPVMDGFAFRGHQVANDRFAKVPVIVFTAGVLDERARALGASAYFTKPFDLVEMLTAIESVA
jgi:CheY-like chemotaxis protein